jgi:hypothetical protein
MPSGDHDGTSSVFPAASKVFRPPSARIFQIADRPFLYEEYATQRPSGDHAGAPSVDEPLKVSRRTFAPVTLMA